VWAKALVAMPTIRVFLSSKNIFPLNGAHGAKDALDLPTLQFGELRLRESMLIHKSDAMPPYKGARRARGGVVVIRQQTCPSAFKKNQKGRRIMASMDLGSLPLGNPCAQCGRPIVAPEWVEDGPGRTSYLWHCWACDYTFEAVAFFEESQDNQALAA
jgi:hypothetical protein